MRSNSIQFDKDCERFMVGLSRISHSGSVDEYSFGRFLGFSNDYTDQLLDYLMVAQLIEFKSTGLCNYQLTVEGCRLLIRKNALPTGAAIMCHQLA
jgi:hypothetical protein